MADSGRNEADVNARIVYWGIPGAGKLTNLRVIHSRLRPDHRGELREIPTDLDPTESYATLPISLGEVGGVRTQIQVATVPGGPEQAPTRKQLLDRWTGSSSSSTPARTASTRTSPPSRSCAAAPHRAVARSLFSAVSRAVPSVLPSALSALQRQSLHRGHL